MDYIREKRIVTIYLGLLVAFLALAGRLFFLQAYRGEAYAMKALRQRTVAVSLEDVARGDILDRKGRSLLDGRSEPRLIAFPPVIENKTQAAGQLAAVLHVEKQEILKRLQGKAGIWPERLSLVQQQQIKALKLTGVEVQAVDIRYGDRPLASNTLGYLGKINSQSELYRLRTAAYTYAVPASEIAKKYTIRDLVGKTGLEGYYEQQLKGAVPLKSLTVTLDGWGNYVRGMGVKVRAGTDQGRNSLQLTLDRDIQILAEDALQAGALKGAVVVMEAGSGDLLALASNPTFRPDQVGDYLSQDAELTFLDQAVCLWQPGSVFKVLAAGAALEEGLVEPTTHLICDDTLIKCNIWPQHSAISLDKALELSCNPAFARLGLELGGARLASYARLFGLGNQTIIGLPRKPDVRQDWGKMAGDIVNSSIGQGPVLVTPVQLTAMMAVVANGGSYVQPRLVKEILGPDGRVVSTFSAGQKHRVISAKTAGQLTTMLEGVVIRGTGVKAGVPGVRIAGKTGSAQTGQAHSDSMPTDGDRNTAPNHTGTEAWFTGFLPAGNPRYVVTVLVHDGASGGETAAPVFRRIARGLTSFSD
ncbi:MAG TPA: penicillin-binding protein 2 [Bacillota bacterium]|nr:penicillin-binding protein 2 [Bacillota bacterium]